MGRRVQRTQLRHNFDNILDGQIEHIYVQIYNIFQHKHKDIHFDVKYIVEYNYKFYFYSLFNIHFQRFYVLPPLSVNYIILQDAFYLFEK